MPLEQPVTGLPPEARSRLSISRNLLLETIRGLRERSAGWRESAAIWAGSISEDEVEWHAHAVWFHHELCDDRAGPLSLELSERAKYALYEQLAAQGMRLVALVHTHPVEWVDLSRVDRRNQLSSRIGFWSLVIPHYAAEEPAPETFGIHVRSSRGWSQVGAQRVNERFLVVD